MTEQQAGVFETTMKDRRSGLIGWGIAHVVLAVICVGIALLTGALALLMGAMAGKAELETPPPDPESMIPSILAYLGMGAFFLILGLGSIRCRRWAAPVIAGVNWLWLVGGILGIIFMAFYMPAMMGMMESSPGMPSGFATGMIVFMMVLMTLLYVLLPAALLLFYTRRDVRATCERRNPGPSWTDGLPMPLMPAILLFGLWAVGVFILGFYNWIFPFFGVLLVGPAGAAALVASSILCAATAWGLARLKAWAWMSAIALTVLWSVSGFLTFRSMTMLDLYRSMQMPEDQLAAMEVVPMPPMSSMILIYGLGALALLGLLAWCRRYFRSAPEQGAM